VQSGRGHDQVQLGDVQTQLSAAGLTDGCLGPPRTAPMLR